MSLTGDRAAIAAALSTATGVTGYVYRPGTPKTGDAWPLLGGLENAGNATTFAVTWRVYVYLPQDERSASEWIDTHHEDLVDALLPVGFVDRIEPVNIGTEQAPVSALLLTMRGE